MLSFTSDQWVIVALIFLLGLLVGGFLFSGGGRKWKTRYNTEIDRRKELERTHSEHEKAWREQDSLRAAALKDRASDERVVTRDDVIAPRDPVVRRNRDRDTNRDGVIDSSDAPRANFVDRVLGRDPVAPRPVDNPDSVPVVDRNGDGVIDDRDR